jgi:hypothetical protein
LERVRHVPGLYEGVAPAEPKVWIPVGLLYSGYSPEELHFWRLAAIVERNALYFCHDLLPIHSHLPLVNI